MYSREDVHKLFSDGDLESYSTYGEYEIRQYASEDFVRLNVIGDDDVKHFPTETDAIQFINVREKVKKFL